MPLGLPHLAKSILGLEAILVSTSQDDLMFDAWSRDGRILTNEDAAGYLGLFVRTRKEVLDALGFQRAPLRASIETDDRILLFRHIEDEYLLVFIFTANVPFGLARVHADDLQRALTQKILGKAIVELPSFEGKSPTHTTIPPPQPELAPQPEQAAPPEQAPQPELAATPELASDTDDTLRIPMPEDQDSDPPTPLETHDETTFFDPTQPATANEDNHDEADDNVAFAIGNIDPEHFETDAAFPHSRSISFPATQEPTATHPPQGASDMSTHEIVIQHTETHILSTTQSLQSNLHHKASALDDVTIGRARMTYEGGLTDGQPCDTPTERARKRPTDPLARLANEGGPVPAQPVDTPTERKSPQPTAQESLSNQLSRLTNEGGPPDPTPVDTATENHRPTIHDPQRQHMTYEGGRPDPTPSDTATEHSSYNHASAHDIVASVRAAQPETNTLRIESVISYVTEHVPNPNTAHARLAIHARVPLELVRTPHRLSTDQILQLEEAAKIMLGVETLPL